MGVRRLAVALLLCLPALVSCGDDDPGAEPSDPTSSAMVEPTPTESPTEGPTSSGVPYDVKGTDEASAKAFVKYWFAVLSASMQTGDVQNLRGLSSPRCGSCRRLATAIADVYDKGGHVETAGWQVRMIETGPGNSASQPEFFLRTTHARRLLYGADGSLVDTDPPTVVAMRVELSPHANSWRLLTLEAVR